jgi:hypothetical protein
MGIASTSIIVETKRAMLEIMIPPSLEQPESSLLHRLRIGQ